MNSGEMNGTLAMQIMLTAVSDYVAGRLDPTAARHIEHLARSDVDVARAIDQAKTVRRRVHQKLKSRKLS